jgi:ankyrin repeat protein
MSRDFLAHAVAMGDSATTAALVARGVPIDGRGSEGETLFHLAARRGHEDVMEVLLSHGADPNALSGRGGSLFDEALSAEQTSAVDWLRQRVGDRLQPSRPRVTDSIVVTVTPEP